VGYCTGMVCTRRIVPLAGAGTLALILPLTIWASGAPLATAITGIAACRLLGGWLSLPPALASLPVLRETTKAGRDNHESGARHRPETSLALAAEALAAAPGTGPPATTAASPATGPVSGQDVSVVGRVADVGSQPLAEDEVSGCPAASQRGR
jgi:hypothetical protein